MKIKILLILLILFNSSVSFSYCVYNATTGSNPLTHKPIQLHVNSFNGEDDINQGGFRCKLTNHRKPNDFSILDIYFITEHLDWYEKHFICRTKLYNAGGYVIISGGYESGAAKFNCTVHRDPN